MKVIHLQEDANFDADGTKPSSIYIRIARYKMSYYPGVKCGLRFAQSKRTNNKQLFSGGKYALIVIFLFLIGARGLYRMLRT